MDLSRKKSEFHDTGSFFSPALAISCASWGEVRSLLGAGPSWPCCSGVLAPEGPGGRGQDLRGCAATAAGPAPCKQEAVGCGKAGLVSTAVLWGGLVFNRVQRAQK